jgi:hypothetical protein
MVEIEKGKAFRTALPHNQVGQDDGLESGPIYKSDVGCMHNALSLVGNRSQ